MMEVEALTFKKEHNNEQEPGKPIKRILFSLALLFFTFSFVANILASGGHEGTKQEQDAGPYHVILDTQPQPIAAN